MITIWPFLACRLQVLIAISIPGGILYPIGNLFLRRCYSITHFQMEANPLSIIIDSRLSKTKSFSWFNVRCTILTFTSPCTSLTGFSLVFPATHLNLGPTNKECVAGRRKSGTGNTWANSKLEKRHADHPCVKYVFRKLGGLVNSTWPMRSISVYYSPESQCQKTS